MGSDRLPQLVQSVEHAPDTCTRRQRLGPRAHRRRWRPPAVARHVQAIGSLRRGRHGRLHGGGGQRYDLAVGPRRRERHDAAVERARRRAEALQLGGVVDHAVLGEIRVVTATARHGRVALSAVRVQVRTDRGHVETRVRVRVARRGDKQCGKWRDQPHLLAALHAPRHDEPLHSGTRQHAVNHLLRLCSGGVVSWHVLKLPPPRDDAPQLRWANAPRRGQRRECVCHAQVQKRRSRLPHAGRVAENTLAQPRAVARECQQLLHGPALGRHGVLVEGVLAREHGATGNKSL